MKKNLLSGLIIGFLFSNPGNAQVNNNFCNLAVFIFNEVNKIHYHALEMNDNWSEKIWLRLISELDPKSLYFTNDDYNNLTSYKDSIDDFLQKQDARFFNYTLILYKKRIESADSIARKVLSSPFNYTLNDTLFIIDKKQPSFPKSQKDLIKRWSSFLKYRALISIFSQNDSLSSKKSIWENVSNKDEETRKHLIKKLEKNFNKLLYPPEGFENRISTIFYNIIASAFDSHTSFFSESEKNDFISGLATENYTLGFDFEENQNNEIEISRLIPGGPAWKSNELNKGDVLISLKSPGKEKIDLTYADENEIEEIFNSSPNITELTVRKPNGQFKTVTLIKEKLRAEENLIKSLVLKGEKKIGYISLPGFYTDWNEHTQGCANDVAKEIIKLKNENIQGIILDLRFNGGGSMQEAIALAGIFIDEGPVCITQERNQRPMVIKDLNRGTIYDGPLLILVNNYSASASEILAATLQDYNRAIIAGNPTFGKASSQIIIPLKIPDNINFLKDKSFIKVTTSKLYRISGKSYQNTGVIPDIIIPGYFDLGYHEIDNENALTKDSIDKKVLFSSLPELPVKEIAASSKKRINNNGNFNSIIHINDSIRMFLKSVNKIALNPKSFGNNELRYYKTIQKIDSLITAKSDIYETANISQNQNYIALDPYMNELNNILQKKIQNDIYITECYRIINDFIKIDKNNIK